MDRQQQNDTTERATGLGRKTREEIRESNDSPVTPNRINKKKEMLQKTQHVVKHLLLSTRTTAQIKTKTSTKSVTIPHVTETAAAYMCNVYLSC